jgi:hypothetical protein
MPNGKPHLDGHLSVGARRVIGNIKRTLNCQCHQTQSSCECAPGTICRMIMMLGKWCRRTRIRIFASSLSYI